MKSYMLVVIAFLLASVDNPQRYDDAVKLESLAGSWEITDGILTATVLLDAATTIVFQEGQFRLDRIDAQSAIGGTYTVNTIDDPRSIDLHYTDGALAGITVKGIWRLEGERLVIGIGDKTDRPNSFTGDHVFVIGLKRTKRPTPAGTQ